MSFHPRKSSFFQVSILLLICILTALLTPSLVKADVGVRPILPGGSSIQPGGDTPIQMAAEVVTMTVRQAVESDNAVVKLNPDSYGFEIKPVWYEVVADVEADFTMRNPTDTEINMTAWFPLASALENVSWNFNPGEIVPTIQNFRVNLDGKSEAFIVNELPNPKGADHPDLPWASFLITFPKESDTLIHISYTVPLSPAAKGYEVALYYIFQTGAGWAGPIGQAELILNLPYPASAETMAPNKKISLPYGGMGQISTGLPVGAKLQGNQARWTWKDFEPGPEDDFAVWLLKPGKWQELQAALSAVRLMPGDGELWLHLAYTFHSLSASLMSNSPMLFSPFYFPKAIDAYQKAEALLPDHPAPHIGLGLLTLSSYYPNIKNTPPDVIRYVQDELRIAKELEARDPALLKGSGLSSEELEFALGGYFYNDATATSDKATLNAMFASETAQATIEYLTRTIWMSGKQTSIACRATPGADCTGRASPTPTPSPIPTLTATLVPSATSLPPTPVPVAKTSGNGPTMIFLAATGILILLVAGYFLLKKSRKNPGR